MASLLKVSSSMILSCAPVSTWISTGVPHKRSVTAGMNDLKNRETDFTVVVTMLIYVL